MVIFDLDGTLIDSSEGIIKAIRYTLNIMGCKIKNGGNEYQFIGPPLIKQFQKACELSEKEASTANNIFVEYYEAYCLNCFNVYPGVEKLLDCLYQEGNVLMLATYKPLQQTFKILETCGLLPYFTKLMCAEKSKTVYKEELLMQGIEALKNIKKRVVYIGDTFGDYIAAVKCGVQFIGVAYGFSKVEFPHNIFVAKKPDDIYSYCVSNLFTKNGAIDKTS